MSSPTINLYMYIPPFNSFKRGFEKIPMNFHIKQGSASHHHQWHGGWLHHLKGVDQVRLVVEVDSLSHYLQGYKTSKVVKGPAGVPSTVWIYIYIYRYRGSLLSLLYFSKGPTYHQQIRILYSLKMYAYEWCFTILNHQRYIIRSFNLCIMEQSWNPKSSIFKISLVFLLRTWLCLATTQLWW